MTASPSASTCWASRTGATSCGGCCRSFPHASTAVWIGRASTGRRPGRASSSTCRSHFGTGSHVASGFSRQSAAFQAMLGAGYPPDILARPPTPGNTFSPVVRSHWETHANNYWDVTTCVFVRELDPLYPMNQLDPLGGSDTKDYNYLARRKAFQLSPRLGQISTDGDICRPLITPQGTTDALLPIKRHGRPFRDAVVAAGRAALHRYYEIQNGNHIERYRQSCCNFTQLEFIQPHAHRVSQLLVDWVERGVL